MTCKRSAIGEATGPVCVQKKSGDLNDDHKFNLIELVEEKSVLWDISTPGYGETGPRMSARVMINKSFLDIYDDVVFGCKRLFEYCY